MAKIKINHADAIDVSVECDLIFTDPPYEMNAKFIADALNNVRSNHLFLISTMKQFVDLVANSDWELNFDVVLDFVTPKKSKSVHQPNYVHSSGFYLTRNNAKSIFSRKLRQRSDTFDANGYWPSILRAPRNVHEDHALAKNQEAITGILGSFKASHVYDPFAGGGSTGVAAWELNINCTLTEIDKTYHELLLQKFKFLGAL